MHNKQLTVCYTFIVFCGQCSGIIGSYMVYILKYILFDFLHFVFFQNPVLKIVPKEFRAAILFLSLVLYTLFITDWY